MRILIVVTHLLGTGHLRRSINLAKAFAEANHTVRLISGGLPMPQFDTTGFALQQLPAVCSDGINFTRLLTPCGQVMTSLDLEARQEMLQSAVIEFRPDAIITELFPFGRRVLRKEFMALLSVATSLSKKPLVLASVRDILSAPSSTAKAQETDDIISRYYDAILVHSDKDTITLDRSWPVSQPLAKKLLYTGYVAQPIDETITVSEGLKEIIVSAGGGSVGSHVFETAIRAARLNKDIQWRVLVGGADSQHEIARLQRLAAGTSAVIEPTRRDFRQLLQRAACSVSLCGYNTAADLLQTGTPGVLIPFDEGGEVEQRIRAESLARLPGYSMLLASCLSGEKLVGAVSSLCKMGRRASIGMRFDGAAKTVELVNGMLESFDGGL